MSSGAGRRILESPGIHRYRRGRKTIETVHGSMRREGLVRPRDGRVLGRVVRGGPVPCQNRVVGHELPFCSRPLWSGCPAVFVEDVTEDASSPYGPVDLHDNVRVVVRWALVQALMWTVAVEVPLIGGQHGATSTLVV
jgi:hypothetical protein